MNVDNDKKAFASKKPDVLEEVIYILLVILRLGWIAHRFEGRPKKRQAERRKAACLEQVDVCFKSSPIALRFEGKVRRQFGRRTETDTA